MVRKPPPAQRSPTMSVFTFSAPQVSDNADREFRQHFNGIFVEGCTRGTGQQSGLYPRHRPAIAEVHGPDYKPKCRTHRHSETESLY